MHQWSTGLEPWKPVEPRYGSSLIPWLFCACVLWLFIRPSKIKYYTDEPPYVKSRLPIVGHVIGLLQYRSYSYVDLLLVGRRDVLGLLTTGLSVLLAKRLAYRSMALIVVVCLEGEPTLLTPQNLRSLLNGIHRKYLFGTWELSSLGKWRD